MTTQVAASEHDVTDGDMPSVARAAKQAAGRAEGLDVVAAVVLSKEGAHPWVRNRHAGGRDGLRHGPDGTLEAGPRQNGEADRFTIALVNVSQDHGRQSREFLTLLGADDAHDSQGDVKRSQGGYRKMEHSRNDRAIASREDSVARRSTPLRLGLEAGNETVRFFGQGRWPVIR